MKSIKLVSFDIGNTLVRMETEGFCTEFSLKTGASKEKLKPLFFEHFLTKNQSLQEAVYKVCDIIGYKNPQRLIDEFRPTAAFLFDDTIEALQELSNTGITMIAISNCTPWEAGGLESFGLNRYLRGVFYSYSIGSAKPDSAIFLYIQKLVDVEPGNILHVGDSWTADIEGAKAVGWQAVFLDRNNNSEISHNNSLNVPIIRSLRELPNLIKFS